VNTRKTLIPDSVKDPSSPDKQGISALEKMKSLKYREGFKVFTDTKEMDPHERTGSKEVKQRSPNRQEIKPSFKKSGTKPVFEYVQSDLPMDIEKVI
jgi:hypothetical protein